MINEQGDLREGELFKGDDLLMRKKVMEDKSMDEKSEFRTIYKANRNLVKDSPIMMPPCLKPEVHSNIVGMNEVGVGHFKEREGIIKNFDKEKKESEKIEKKKIVILDEHPEILEPEEDDMNFTDYQKKREGDDHQFENIQTNDFNSEYEVMLLKNKIDALIQENSKLRSKLEKGENLKNEEINYLHQSRIENNNHLLDIENKLNENDLKLSKIKTQINNYQSNPTSMRNFLSLQNDADRLSKEKEDLIRLKNTLNTEIKRNEVIINDKDHEIEQLLKDNENLKRDLGNFGNHQEVGDETELLEKELLEQEMELLRKQESIIRLEEKRKQFKQNIDDFDKETNLFHNEKNLKISEIRNYPVVEKRVISTDNNYSKNYQSPFSNNQTVRIIRRSYNTENPHEVRYVKDANPSNQVIYKKYTPDDFKKPLVTERIVETTSYHQPQSIYSNEVNYPVTIRRESRKEGQVLFSEQKVDGFQHKRVIINDRENEIIPFKQNYQSKTSQYEDEKMNSNEVFETFRKRD